MGKRRFLVGIVFTVICAAFSIQVEAQRKTTKATLGKICGNPQLKCRIGDMTFQDHEIPFEIPVSSNSVIVESETFYAVILKTVKLNTKTNCENAISENERLEIQQLFPDHKVFALKCSEAGDLYYTNVSDNLNFIAVYAGKNMTEANSFLKKIKAANKFAGANLRKMQAGINGT